MFRLTVQIEDNTRRVSGAAERATFRNLGHAAARISKDVKASLVTADGASPEGSPPHTHQGAYLRRAIRYDHDRKAQSALIGPLASSVGEAGAAHEFGQEFHGQDYPERSFMAPALQANEDRFAQEWQGAIGE